MKRLNVIVAALGLAAGAALAQPPGPPVGGRFDLDELAILLDLDAYQKGEVERVLTEQREAMRAEREAMRAAREQGAASGERPTREEMHARRDEMRAQREQNREALFGKLANTLTEQQIAKLEILLEPPRGGRGGHGPGGRL